MDDSHISEKMIGLQDKGSTSSLALQVLQEQHLQNLRHLEKVAASRWTLTGRCRVLDSQVVILVLISAVLNVSLSESPLYTSAGFQHPCGVRMDRVIG